MTYQTSLVKPLRMRLSGERSVAAYWPSREAGVLCLPIIVVDSQVQLLFRCAARKCHAYGALGLIRIVGSCDLAGQCLPESSLFGRLAFAEDKIWVKQTLFHHPNVQVLEDFLAHADAKDIYRQVAILELDSVRVHER